MLLMELFLIPACFYAAIHDFLFYKIPNWLVALIIGVYVVKSIALIIGGAPLDILILPSISFFAVIIVGFVFFIFKIFGAGDTKLLAACSLWMSEVNIYQFILLVALSGGILALLYLFQKVMLDFLREFLLAKIVDKFDRVSDKIKNENMVPYGVAIFAGVLWTIINNG
jgi:prepilin peptidase CpaA